MMSKLLKISVILIVLLVSSISPLFYKTPQALTQNLLATDLIWHLRNRNTSGVGDISLYYGSTGHTPIVGDWNGDGIDTPGYFNPDTGWWYLRNSNSTGSYDLIFQYGNPGDVPLVGDWNGDGVDTIGVYRSPMWHLRNSNTSGSGDISFQYGDPGDVPLVGDWNGDGVDTIGVYRSPMWHLRNSNTSGFGNISIHYGDPGDLAIVGDWNGDGIDTPGVIRGGTPPSSNRNLNVRYVDQVYVQQQMESGYWNHCGPASTAMVLHYEGAETRDVFYSRAATLDLVCEVKKGCSGVSWVDAWDPSQNKQVGIIPAMSRRGVSSYYDGSPTFNEIKQSIDNGHPVIIGMQEVGHLIVIRGYADNNRVLVNDPYGGQFWWNYSYPNNTNAPPSSSPRSVGENIEYIYDNQIHARYAVFVSGSVPNPYNTSLTLSGSENAIVDDVVTLDFSTLDDSSPITITYAPQVAPNYNYQALEMPVETFVLSAEKETAVGRMQLASMNGTQYQINIDVDLDKLDSWRIPMGLIAPDNQGTNSATLIPQYVLKR